MATTELMKPSEPTMKETFLKNQDRHSFRIITVPTL